MQAEQASQISSLCSLARTRIREGDYDGARSYLYAARVHARETPTPELLRLLADLTAQLSDFAAGVQLMEQALDAFRLAQDRAGEVVTAGDLAALIQRNGNLGRARTLIEWALGHVDVNNQLEHARLLNIAASIAAFQGRLTDSLGLLQAAQRRVEGRLAGWIELNTIAALANLRRLAEAQQSFLHATAMSASDDTYTQLMLQYVGTWLALVQGDFATARSICQSSLQRMAPEQHPIVYLPTIATLGVLAREAGDLSSAEAFFSQALGPLQARHDLAAILGISLHQSLIARERGEDNLAKEQLQSGLRQMSICGYGTTLLWQPERFAELFRWGIERGIEVAYTEQLLQTSLASWLNHEHHSVGNTGYMHQTTSMPATTACAILTHREREVLRLVADGLHDREIADLLKLSIRTVQNHLQRCYTKLGVSGRIAAVRALGRNRALSE